MAFIAVSAGWYRLAIATVADMTSRTGHALRNLRLLCKRQYSISFSLLRSSVLQVKIDEKMATQIVVKESRSWVALRGESLRSSDRRDRRRIIYEEAKTRPNKDSILASLLYGG